MPTYAYACTECGHRFEAVQSFSDASLTQCPECAGRLRKVFSSVGVVFKGSGFYRTDSRKAASASDRSEKKESAAAATSGSAGSSDAGGSANGAKPNPSSSTTGTTTPAKAAS